MAASVKKEKKQATYRAPKDIRSPNMAMSHSEWSIMRRESLEAMLREQPSQNGPVYVHRFSVPELEKLMDRYGFAEIGQKISNLTFRQILMSEFNMDDMVLMDHIWRVFDRNSNSSITFKDFSHGLSIMLLGTEEERLEFCFNVYTCGSSGKTIDRMYLNTLLGEAIHMDDDADLEDVGTTKTWLLDLTLQKFNKEAPSASAREGGSNLAANSITFEQYKAAVKAQPLLNECFGNVLPSQECAERLLAEISGK